MFPLIQDNIVADERPAPGLGKFAVDEPLPKSLVEKLVKARLAELR